MPFLPLIGTVARGLRIWRLVQSHVPPCLVPGYARPLSLACPLANELFTIFEVSHRFAHLLRNFLELGSL